MSFFAELKRRKVFRIGAAYAIVAWILIQIASIAFPALNLPSWAITLVTVLIIIGFPFALLLAWAYELTPDGIKADSAVQASQTVIQTSDRKLTYVLIALVLLVAGFQIADRFDAPVGVISNNQTQTAGPVDRFDYTLPSDQSLRSGNGLTGLTMALSPDGRRFVYNTTKGLYLREMGELEARLIPGTEEELFAPVFSPDGQSIAYWATSGQLKRIAVSGGTPVLIANVPGTSRLSWEEDDTILFGQFNVGIFRVSANGGVPELIIESQEGEASLSNPTLLPDGDSVLFSVQLESGSSMIIRFQIVVQSLSSGQRTVLIQNGSDPSYLSSGYLVYSLGNDLFGVAFDAATLIVSGGATPLVQGLQTRGVTLSTYRVAQDGTLVYLSDEGISLSNTLVWVDREGREEAINVPPQNYVSAQLSPDGTRVALDSRDDEDDIWIFDLARETLQRLTLDGGWNRAPLWSPDGRIIFSRQIDGSQEIYIQAADGSGLAEKLTDNSTTLTVAPTGISADGTTLFYWEFEASTGANVWMVSLQDGTRRGQPLLNTPTGQMNASLSPDGRWLVYQSTESGQTEVYVRPFPDVNSGRTQVSTSGGSHPLWSRDGSELFYLDLGGAFASGTGALMVVSIEKGTEFVPGIPERLFEQDVFAPNSFRQVYDVSADGQRFLMLKNATENNNSEERFIIVQNWVEELKRLVPTE